MNTPVTATTIDTTDDDWSRIEEPALDNDAKKPQLVSVTEYRDSTSSSSDSDSLTETLEDAVEYWRSTLEACECAPFPTLPSGLEEPVPDQVVEYALHINQEDAAVLIRAAWALIVSRMTGFEEAVFGVAGRCNTKDDEASEVVAPWRVRVATDQMVSEYLGSIQQQVDDVISFQHLGLQEIAEISPGARQACRFQTLFRFIPETTTEVNQEQNKPCSLELDFYLGSRIQVGFDSRVVGPWTVKKLLERLHHVVQQLDNPDNLGKAIGDIDIMTREDLEQIWRWNKCLPPAVNRFAHEAIEENARSNPLGPAVSAWDGQLTFGKLDRLATQLSRLLMRLDVGPEVIVPLCFEKSMWTPVAMLAVLKASGAFVLLDSTLPEQRLEEIVGQVGDNMIVSSTRNQDLSRRLARKVIILDHDYFQAGIQELPIPKPRQVTPNSTAYVVFTSGSTGIPKGVMITHRNIATSFLGPEGLLGVTPKTRLYDFASYSFTVALSNFFLALPTGACLCIPSEQDRRANLATTFGLLKANMVIVTPSVAENLSPESMPGLESLVFAGEAVKAKDSIPWFGQVKLTTAYGSSECTTAVTFNSYATTAEQFAEIGKARDVVTWLVDPDDHNQLVPPGCIGEIVVEGYTIAKGYLQDPQKTASVFINDPDWLLKGSTACPGRRGRLYKTGDLGRYTEDGNLAYLGRKDAQVKIRGQRVELGDVEHWVRDSIPEADRVVVEVVVSKGESSSPLLAAFVWKESEAQSDSFSPRLYPVADSVEDRLRDKLPSYMVPVAFFLVQQLPMTTTGKINRRQVREIGSQFSIDEIRGAGSMSKRTPSTRVEFQVRDIWASVLKMNPDSIGLDDSFLRLGGDSVSAVRAVGEARKAGIELRVSDILRRPRLHQVAADATLIGDDDIEVIAPFSLLGDNVDAKALVHDIATQNHLDPADIQDVYPCTPLQEGLLLLTSKRPGDHMMQVTTKLAPDVDIQRLRDAWEEVTKNTDILRSRVVQHSEYGLLQVVLDEKIKWIESTATLDDYMQTDRQKTMELGQPLVRYGLVQDAGEYWTVWTAHHAIYDGWSMPIVVENLSRAYENKDLDVGPDFRSFIQYSKAQAQEETAEYWQQSLHGYESVPFPTLPHSVEDPIADGYLELSLPRPRRQGLDVTESTMIRGAWALVVSQMINSDDVLFGVTVSGRDAPVAHIDKLIGPAIATVPLRVRPADNQTVSSYLDAVQQQASDMMSFEQYGLQNIARLSQDAQQACKFQTLIVVQPEDNRNTHDRIGNWRFENQDRWANTHGLTIDFYLGEESIVVNAFYDTRVLKNWTVQNLLRRLEHVMNKLDHAGPRQQLADIKALSQHDLNQVWEWNAILPEPVQRCAHDMFQEQAQLTPDAPAVDAWDGQLTYLELDKLSTKLASHIRDSGIGTQPNMIVPLLFEKSLWTTVAILGVLKADAAFVLLEPSLPQQRLHAIIEQVKPSMVLSSQSYQALGEEVCEKALVIDGAMFSRLSDENLRELDQVSPSSLMYIVFTSGSTGTPKGVMVAHENYAAAIHYQSAPLGYTQESRIFDFASYSFDTSIENTFFSLANGSCICVPSDQDRKDGLAQSIVALRANRAELTPSVTQLIDPASVPELKAVIFGGEGLRLPDISPWWGKAEVINTYGPSECTPTTLMNLVAKSPEEAVRIGKGVGVNVWIVHPENHDILLPPSCVGEMLIEGPLVGRGYLYEPIKTAAVFVSDPTWLLQGAPGRPGRHGRLYKTGDLAEYNEDGSLTFVGRKDSQVKIRGQRVELGEIEHALLDHELVEAAAVLMQSSQEGRDAHIAAFVTLGKSSTEITNYVSRQNVQGQIYEKLRAHLPDYMVPQTLTILDQMPINRNGKLDRHALLSQSETQPSRGPTRQPSSDAERQMQQIWSRVLRLDLSEIGLDDSFFQLGGNSIDAMKTTAQARKIGVQLATADIFRHRTLEEVTKRAQPIQGSSPDRIPRVQSDGSVVQSFAQEALYFLDQLHPGLTWYNMANTTKLRGPLNLDALAASVRALEERHEILRTVFWSQDGVSVQSVLPPSQRHLRIVDVSEDNILDELEKDQTRVFNLETGPCWNVTILRIDEGHYILSLVMHHILSDGWSIDIIRKELAGFYSASLRNQDVLHTVQPLPIQYRDYSVWQKQSDRVKDHKRQLDYWVKQLENSRPAEFLCDKPRPATLSGKAGVEHLRIGGTAYENLTRFCKENHVTTFIALFAAFRATHFRLSGQTDAVIGSPSANRDRLELKDLVGFFVNLQAIRVQLEEESFSELVRKVQSALTSSMANQTVPFEHIVTKLEKRDRDLSRNPLVQVVFALNGASDFNHFASNSIECEDMPIVPTSRFDVEFHLFEAEDALEGMLVYSTDLYDATTMKTVLSVFDKILEEGIKAPHTPVASLPLMKDEDYAALNEKNLLQINRTDYPRDSSIVDVFRQQVEDFADKIAVKDQSSQLTYAQLDRLSDILASWLYQQSLPAESLVGVYSSRCCQTIVAFLGILKAKLAYLPLDPKIPAGRVETILASVPGKKFVLVGPNDQAPLVQLDNVEFVHLQDVLDQHILIDIRHIRQPSPTSLAYVMFTSGSTGQPKGVMVEHKGIVRLVKRNAFVDLLPDRPTVAHISNTAFDAATWEIYTALLNGGTVICIDTNVVLDHRAIAQVFIHEQIQTMLITPALLKQYLLHCPETISTMHTMIVGAERLDPVDTFKARKLIKGHVINGYGPTEGSCISCIYPLPEDELCVNGVPIGRSFDNSGAYVMDSHQQPVPLGVVGELVVTGDGVARGYTDVERNIDRFITVDIAGERVRAYRTGDYTRCRPIDGQLEFMGRVDGQMKIRGQRIEVGEIEHVLRRHDAVDDAVTVLQQEDGRSPQLVGFITLRKEDSFDADEAQRQLRIELELFSLLRANVPSYMVPQNVIILDTMPINDNGKIDRRALASMFPTKRTVEKERIAIRMPTSEAQKQMQTIWADVLGVKPSQIGTDNSFFQVGGNSIAAMKIVAEARKIGLTLVVADVFRYPVLHQLTKRALLETADKESSSPIPLADRSKPIEQSFAQQQLWFLEQLYPGLTWYLMPFSMRIHGPLHVGALKAALLAVESRHETLRTTFAMDDDNKTVQRVQPFQHNDLNVIDISEDQLMDAVERDHATVFDLTKEPGWRTRLYRVSPNEHVLSIILHHIVGDGWSIDLLYKELSTFYSAAIQGHDPLAQIEPLPIQYADYSVWQRKLHVDHQLDYWVRKLQCSRPAELLPDKSRPAQLSGVIDTRSFKIQGSLYSQLQEFCKTRGVTPFSVLLAAFRATQYRLTGQEDATIGAPNANRDRDEVKNIIGFFVNMQCLRTKIGPDDTFEDLVQQVQTTSADSLANQHVPFERIVSKLSMNRDLSRHPVVQLVFAVHSQMDLGKLCLEGVETEILPVPFTSNFDLEFHIFQEQDTLQASVLYSTDLFVPETISNLVSIFNTVLEEGLEHPKFVITTMPLLSNDGYIALRDMGLIQTELTSHHLDTNVVDVFRSQVAASPSRIAVRDNTTGFTYAQLDALSGNISRALLRKGLKPESLVGVFAKQSPQTIATFLGILKAGLAYVPLDVNTSSARIGSILASTKDLSLVMTDDALPLTMSMDKIETVAIDSFFQDDNTLESSIEYPALSASSLVYVMFEFDSSGAPKGAMVEHGALVNCLNRVKISQLVQNDGLVMAQIGNIGHLISTWEIYGALLNGGTLVCIDRETLQDDIVLSHTFSSNKIQTAITTPIILEQYLSSSPTILAGLDSLLVGGERTDPKKLLAAQRVVRGKVFNVFGRPEIILSTSHNVLDNGEYSSGELIGRAMEGSEAYVVDTNLRLLPLGVMGELVLTSNLARGYVDSQQTADKFVTINVRGQQKQIFRTGDYVRYRPSDGQLEYFGPVDAGVKVDGHRVDIGQVERVLHQHDAVRYGVIIAQHEDTSSNARLVGFITVISKETEKIVQELQKQLRARLSAHMIPDTIIILDNMPIDENGKVDRSALIAQIPQRATVKMSKTRKQPRLQKEHDLQRIWADELQIASDEVGINDSFFQLGGNSISAMKVIAEARKVGIPLNVTDIFRHETIAELITQSEHNKTQFEELEAPDDAVVLVEANTKAALISEIPTFNIGLTAADVQDVLPVTSIQDKWIQEGVCNYFHIHLGDAVDVARLKQSLTQLTQTLRILRSRFLEISGNRWQVVLRQHDNPIKVVDVDENLEMAFQSLCAEDDSQWKPTDTPFALLLLRSQAEGVRLVIRMTHAQYDGFCLPLILKSLIASYEDRPAPATVDYSRYLTYKTRHHDESSKYWRKLLQDSSPTTLDLVKPHISLSPADSKPTGIQVLTKMDTPQLPHNITLATLTSSAWAILLSHITGRDDVTFGHLVACRNAATRGIEQIVGPCLNVLPVRVTLPSSRPEASTLLSSVQQQFLSSGKADSFNYREIFDECAGWKGITDYDFLAHHQNIEENPEFNLGGTKTELGFYMPWNRLPPWKVYMVSYPRADKLQLKLLTNTGVMNEAAGKRLLGLLTRIIGKLAESAKTSAALLPIDEITKASLGV